jgi:hypothetical protein
MARPVNCWPSCARSKAAAYETTKRLRNTCGMVFRLPYRPARPKAIDLLICAAR